ncbi:MAG: dihydrolipoamide acetyltransferase family protein [Fimbriiglobus sp.]
MDFPLPPVGEGLLEVELLRWLVKPGDQVTRGQSLAELMSDKATMELPSPFVGEIRETLGTPGKKVKVGEVILRYEGAAAPAIAVPETPTTVAPAAVMPTVVATTASKVAASPSIRLLARKLNIDLTTVHGTGPGGRVLLEDVTALISSKSEAKAKPIERPAFDFGKAGTRVKLVGLRRKIAEQMVASASTIPHFSYMDECDFTALVNLRNQLKDPMSTAGVKLTYLPFLIKAVTRALKEIPIVNSTFDDASEEITLHDRYHIGIAVAAPTGLVVPVIKDADQKDIAAIAGEIERLSREVRSGKAKIDDLRGSTFTITSIGNIGGLIATPIINKPEVGIVAMGKLVKRPVFDAAGQITAAEMGYLSFSFDHRIVDGAVGAMFGNAVIRRLQNPAALLLADRLAS